MFLFMSALAAGCGVEGPCQYDEKCVPLSTEGSEPSPEIFVDQREIDFGRFAVGVTETSSFRIENPWGPPLEIESIQVVESTLDDRGGAELRLEENGTRVLEEGESLVVRLIYEPADESPDSGYIHIASNAPAESRVSISIDSTVTYCSRTSPEELDFGEVALGETETREVTVENCNRDVPLRVMDLFVDRHANLFILETTELDERDGELFVPPNSVASVEIQFTPEVAIDYFSSLAVFTEDAERVVELSATGVE